MAVNWKKYFEEKHMEANEKKPEVVQPAKLDYHELPTIVLPGTMRGNTGLAVRALQARIESDERPVDRARGRQGRVPAARRDPRAGRAAHDEAPLGARLSRLDSARYDLWRCVPDHRRSDRTHGSLAW
jgi:hypothetical protein